MKIFTIAGRGQNVGSALSLPSQSRKRSHDGTLLGAATSTAQLTSTSKTNGLKQQNLDDGIHVRQFREPVAVSRLGQGLKSSEEKVKDKETAKNELLEALEDLNDLSFGSFSTHGQILKAFNPGLSIEGLGGVGLPLSVLDARRIALAATGQRSEIDLEAVVPTVGNPPSLAITQEVPVMAESAPARRRSAPPSVASEGTLHQGLDDLSGYAAAQSARRQSPEREIVKFGSASNVPSEVNLPENNAITLPPLPTLPARHPKLEGPTCGAGVIRALDTTARRIWELNSSAFQLRNPAWQQTLDEIVAKVAAGLGISSDRAGVRADLHKLLLYGEGASDDRQIGSDAPGLLGTLAIALPSVHTGGAVKASFKHNEKNLETAPNSEFDISYLAWYTNVQYASVNIASKARA